MRTAAMCLWIAAAASAGCLRSTQFACTQDTECGATGRCEAVGYCSVPNADCAGTQRSYGDSAGAGLSNTCVPGGNPGLDGGLDAPIDVPVTGCPSPYVAVAGSAHRYKALTSVAWDTAKTDCKLTSTSAYLAVPDDATELMNLATAAMGLPFWIGIDDQAIKGTFVTQKGATATFLPWATNEPDQGNPPKECVNAVSATQIATEKCGTAHTAVCECEP
jgi:Lectin C-type domain